MIASSQIIDILDNSIRFVFGNSQDSFGETFIDENTFPSSYRIDSYNRMNGRKIITRIGWVSSFADVSRSSSVHKDWQQIDNIHQNLPSAKVVTN